MAPVTLARRMAKLAARRLFFLAADPKRPLMLLGISLGLAGAATGQCRPPAAARGNVVDRIAAIVDGRPILASQVRQAAWYARFSAARPPARHAPARLSAEDCRQSLEHLINEALIASAMPARAPRPRLAPQLARLEPLYGGQQGLERAWSRFHLRPKEAQRIMRLQLALLNFLDRKFEARAQPAAEAVRDYYTQEYLPLTRQKHVRPAPLAAVRTLIIALLRRRQLGWLEQAWLRRRRGAARIRIRLRWPSRPAAAVKAETRQ